MSHDVHHQLARVAIRDAQFVATILQRLALLLRMPRFICDPSSALGREAQDRDLVRLAAEDAVRARVVVVEIGIGQVERSVLQYLRTTQAIERERSQLVVFLVPRIQIPSLAIVREPLWRDRALGLPITATGMIFEPELASLQRC